jgi:hypothetical protein
LCYTWPRIEAESSHLRRVVVAIAIAVGLAETIVSGSVFGDDMAGMSYPQMKTGPQIDSRVISLLREAMEIAERLDDRQRMPVRANIGGWLQRLGLAAEFGSYAADAIGAREKFFHDRIPPDPEGEAQSNKLQELEAEAKRRVVSGDLLGARDVYLSAEDLRDDHNRAGALGADVRFLEWKLEAGDLAGAVDLYRSVDWRSVWTHVEMARRIASAFNAMGQRSKGLRILMELRPSSDVDDAYMILSYLGQALWKVGETEESKAVLRDAAKASLAAVHRDVRLPLSGYTSCEPISIARIQSAISDQEGAQETLHGILKLESPLEYEPPWPRPADLSPNAIYIAGPPSLVPAAKRWLDARTDLVWRLARAGLDDEAVSFLAAPNAKQLDLLGYVILGQAQRGSFVTAFQTVERLRNDPLTTQAEPSMVILKPTGEISVHTQQSPVRSVEDLERKAALRIGLRHIMRNAARLGDVDVFKRAELLSRQIAPESSDPMRVFSDLGMLAKAGQVDTAIEFARAVPNLDGRVSALLSVVLGITGVLSSLDDPFFR